MSLSNAAPETLWQRCTLSYVKTLPVLDFPFEQLPDVYAPASTVLQIAEGRQVYAFKWCYLSRDSEQLGVVKSFDVSSLSEKRVRAMPLAMERMSKWLRFNNARPRTAGEALGLLGRLLLWADLPEHAGRFEEVLSNSAIALEALKIYHSYLRSKVQSHLLSTSAAAARDQSAIACLSEIHGINYRDHIEPLQRVPGKGTETPAAQLVSEFSSTLQAIFDSASDMVLGDRPVPPGVSLRISATDDSKTVKLRAGYGPMRLMELACVAYAGLVFVDSGSNLAVLQAYEEPEDLEEQLAKPDRINLTKKAVKFRAGSKQVEVHLSATTMTRLKTYLRVRQKLVTSLTCGDIAPMFVQCNYDNSRGEPTTICALDKEFLTYIRRKVERIGACLPNVTLRQLRAYKQQILVRRAPIPVAAKLMCHSVETAVKAYSKALDATRRGEIGEFMGSLQETVLSVSEKLQEQSNQKIIPIGMCADHGMPSPIASVPVVAPDCNKVEGCFFCENYRLHADVEDMRKLMSCRLVLQRIIPLNEDSIRAERVYTAVVDRIDALLGELKRRQPLTFETVRVDVEERSQLTRFWANKLQQLFLLGMLPSAGA